MRKRPSSSHRRRRSGWARGATHCCAGCSPERDAAAALTVAVWLAVAPGGTFADSLWAIAFVPAWIVIAKLLGLYDRDQRALRHLTVDELPNLVALGARGHCGAELLPLGDAGRHAGVRRPRDRVPRRLPRRDRVPRGCARRLASDRPARAHARDRERRARGRDAPQARALPRHPRRRRRAAARGRRRPPRARPRRSRDPRVGLARRDADRRADRRLPRPAGEALASSRRRAGCSARPCG